MEHPYEWFLMCVHSKSELADCFKKATREALIGGVLQLNGGNHPQIIHLNTIVHYIKTIHFGAPSFVETPNGQ